MPKNRNYSLLEHLLFPPVSSVIDRLKPVAVQKTILITGSSYGIGEILCYQLADTEAHLILVARTEDKLQQIKNELQHKPAKITIFAVDLTDQQQVDGLIAELLLLPNGIDIFVSNAGKSICRSISASLDRFHDFQRTMALNYFAPVQLCLALMPLLKARKGQIISISAVNVLLTPMPFWAAYQASKAAFDHWFASATLEFNHYGIAMTSIYLPLVKTRMIEPTLSYKNTPAMNPQHVANIICRAIVTRKAKFAPWWLIFGQIASLLFGSVWFKVAPYLLRKKFDD